MSSTHRRALLFGSDLPANVIVGPVRVKEDDQRIYVAGTTLPIVIPGQTQGNGAWTHEASSATEDGYDAYNTSNGTGYEFTFYGTGFRLGGFSNGNGGDFQVLLDDQPIGIGSCFSQFNSVGNVHFEKRGMPLGTYKVTALKLSGSALYCDTVSLYGTGSKALRWPNTLTTTGPSLLNAAYASFTIEMWVNPTFQDLPGYNDQTVAQYLFFGAGIRCYITPGSIVFRNDVTSNQLVAATGLAQGGWSHLRLTYEAYTDTGRIEVNNVVRGELVGMGAFASFQNLDFGYVESARAYNALNGLLDEIRIWGYARSVAQNAASWQKKNAELADLSTATGAWDFEEFYENGEPFNGYTDGSGHGKTLRTTTGAKENEQEPSSASFVAGTVDTGPLNFAADFTFSPDSQFPIVTTPADYRGSFTFETWIKPNQDEAARRRMDIYFLDGNFILWIAEYAGTAPGQAGRLEVYNYQGSGPAGPVLTNNEWAHIALSYEAGTAADNFKLYVNGQFFSAATFAGPFGQSSDKLEVGHISSDGARRYRGLMDEVRLWPTVRTAAQIAEFYNKEYTGSERPDFHFAFNEPDTAGTIRNQGVLGLPYIARPGIRHAPSGVTYLAPPTKGKTMPFPAVLRSEAGVGIRGGITATADWTLEFWVKTDAWGNFTPAYGGGQVYQLLFGCGGAFQLTNEPGYIGFYSYVSAQGMYKMVTNTPGTWVHFAIRSKLEADGTTTASIFANGQLLGSQPLPMIRMASLDFGHYRDNSATYAFYGELDEVRVWDYARADSQIAAYYTTRTKNLTDTLDLAAAWDFEQPVSLTAPVAYPDTTGRGNLAYNGEWKRRQPNFSTAPLL